MEIHLIFTKNNKLKFSILIFRYFFVLSIYSLYYIKSNIVAFEKTYYRNRWWWLWAE